jgi:hypothetical protein
VTPAEAKREFEERAESAHQRARAALEKLSLDESLMWQARARAFEEAARIVAGVRA